MNLGGIKVSSAEIEEVLNAVSGIREVAAIACVSARRAVPVNWSFTLCFYREQIPIRWLPVPYKRRLREHLNPLFRIHGLIVVDALPRTASNKIMRRVLRAEQSC